MIQKKSDSGTSFEEKLPASSEEKLCSGTGYGVEGAAIAQLDAEVASTGNKKKEDKEGN